MRAKLSLQRIGHWIPGRGGEIPQYEIVRVQAKASPLAGLTLVWPAIVRPAPAPAVVNISRAGNIHNFCIHKDLQFLHIDSWPFCGLSLVYARSQYSSVSTELQNMLCKTCHLSTRHFSSEGLACVSGGPAIPEELRREWATLYSRLLYSIYAI